MKAHVVAPFGRGILRPMDRAGTGGSGRPNLVVVVLDTLTADAAGLDRAATPMPALARLAERGTSFRHAVSNAPWTLPAHGSLLTGLLPSEHRMDTSQQFALWEGEPRGWGALASILPDGPVSDPELGARWLPRVLASAGYETALASNNPWVGRLTQMHHGFHRIRDTLSVHVAPRRALFRGRPRLRRNARAAYYAYRAVRGRGDLLARDAMDRIAEWLGGRDRSRPFFLLVNLIEAHAPYLTPEAARAVREAGAGPLLALRTMRLLDPRLSIAYNLGGEPRERHVGAVDLARRLHRHAARYLDGLVRELHELVSGQGRDALFCVTSDHGESFGEHGALQHGFTVDEPALHVPLVVAGVGVPVREVAATVDIRRVYATVLDAAGLAVPEGAGPSLLAAPGAPTGAQAGTEAVAVAERERVALPGWARRDWPEVPRRTERLRALYRDPWKLVVEGDRERLYHLGRDPEESVDRARDEPEVLASLRSALPPWPQGEPMAQAAAGPDARGGPAGNGQALTGREEEELVQRLSALGYLE
jgi:arylsulfatase A-like enzyme